MGLSLDARGLDRFISFDVERGVICCEAGVMLRDILDLVVPKGWFLPVSPGTKFVTVGGAIANDVHGKNHHCAGSFGCHVRQFELRTMQLLDRLDEIVRESGGAVYPAKDARMSAESFRHYFQNWRSFCEYIDPSFSSSFWRRVAS